MRKFIKILCLCLCLCITACLASCVADSISGETATNASEQNIIVQSVSGVVAELTFEEMLGKSHIAAKGEITGISRSFGLDYTPD